MPLLKVEEVVCYASAIEPPRTPILIYRHMSPSYPHENTTESPTDNQTTRRSCRPCSTGAYPNPTGHSWRRRRRAVESVVEPPKVILKSTQQARQHWLSFDPSQRRLQNAAMQATQGPTTSCGHSGHLKRLASARVGTLSWPFGPWLVGQFA